MNLSEKIKKIRGHLSQEEFASLLGVNKTRIVSIENNKALKLTTEEIDKLINNFNISSDWLLTGKGEMHIYDSRSTDRKEFAAIPFYGYVTASAGTGIEIFDETPTAQIGNFFDALSIPENTDLVSLIVEGDSMEPRLNTGDRILVDKSIRTIYKERTYLVRYDGTLMVKNIQKIPGGYRLISTNPAYVPIEIYADMELEFTVLGAVVGMFAKM
jgi:repressor LexA